MLDVHVEALKEKLIVILPLLLHEVSVFVEIFRVEFPDIPNEVLIDNFISYLVRTEFTKFELYGIQV